jgi:hypothetical protein
MPFCVRSRLSRPRRSPNPMKLPSDRRAAEAIASLRDPRESENWFRNLPPERREQMTREFRDKHLRQIELRILDRERALRESACMGGAFLLVDAVCPGGGVVSALLSLMLGSTLGFACSRLDANRLLTSILGMLVFLGSQYVLQGGLSMFHIAASFPMGIFFALLGFQREDRGMV